MKLTTDLIYEAALDDALFAELPSILADAMDARSCVLHWRDKDGAAEIFTHSGYFSDAHMADYASNFATHDLWTEAGMRQGCVNRAWNTTDLVPATDYEQSTFYNDWIRAMGDDTFYCCGSVMQTAIGHGIIGLHRGKTQADFSPKMLGQLNKRVEHLRRMFALRGRVASLTARGNLLNAIFTSSPQPSFVLSSSGRVMMASAAGEAFLRAGRFLRLRNGQLGPAIDENREAYELAISAASETSDRRAAECLLMARDGSVVLMSLTPLSAPLSDAAILMTIAEPRKRLPGEIVAGHLQRVYGLTGAEADIALRLADGQTIRDISDARRSTIGTVRTQVKHILLKMDAKRQSDVVRAVVAFLA